MRMKVTLNRGTALLAGAALSICVQAGQLKLEVGTQISSRSIDSALDSRLRLFGNNAAALTKAVRTKRGDRVQFSLPVTVFLTKNGVALPVSSTKSRDSKLNSPKAGETLTLSFEGAGSRSFPAAYRTHLESTFTAAKSAMDAFFGSPKANGTVRVLNYDADIQDRTAVAGGAYVPNAVGGPEIRFPVYNSPVAASLNFIHTLLLAYRLDSSTPFDAWNEGLVRAAVISIARTPGTIPGSPTSDEIEAALGSLYDAGSVYDWCNQPGLGTKTFIAPNLLNTTLPVGDSAGGPYLLRYQMAGTAFSKILTEHPGFVAEFNRRFYAAPAAFQTQTDLSLQAQSALNAVSGSAAATVEGQSFSNWSNRQFVLDGDSWPGVRSVIQAFAIAPDAGTSDFGVFGIISHATRLLTNGDEILLSGRTYPVYWRPDSLRFFTTLQDDIIDFAGGYGSVAPNFPSSTFDGQIYRVMVDVPFLSTNSRVSLPAGAVATGANPNFRPLYGTLVGFPRPAAGQSYSVQLTYGAAAQNVSVQNQAFSFNFNDANFDRAQSITLRVIRTVAGVPTTLLTRKVSKPKGDMGLELIAETSWINQTVNLANRLNFIGLAAQPLRPSIEQVLGSTAANTLIAQWDSRQGRFILSPDAGGFVQGIGVFARPNGPVSRSHQAKLDQNELQTVSLQPGWNSVSAPNLASVLNTSLQAAAGAEALSTYTEAQGSILGTTLFSFVPDPVNPDLGTYQPATTFAAGKALWVRCLRTEGGILVFPAPVSTGAISRGRFAWGDPIPSPSPTTGPLWELGLDFFGERGRYSWVQFGADSKGTANFDAKLDSELPPSPGGFQAMTLNKNPHFRDIRGSGGSTWQVRLTGLTPGQFYELKVRQIKGAPKGGQITMAGTNQRFTLKPNFRNYFMARSATQELSVTAW